MRERGRKNRTSATMLAGWKKAVVLMLALIMCISSIVVPQPEEVSAKQATYIDYFGEDQPKNREFDTLKSKKVPQLSLIHI